MEICFTPTDGAAVYVHGEGANPRIRKCVIHHSNCVGVFVEDHAGVSWAVWTRSTILLLYIIYFSVFISIVLYLYVQHVHGLQYELLLWQGVVEDCNIHANKLAGVWIKSHASPRFLRNKVRTFVCIYNTCMYTCLCTYVHVCVHSNTNMTRIHLITYIHTEA